KSAYRLSNFSANQNTANYDVVYHRLDLTVNPAVQFISGSITTNFIALESMSTMTFDMSQFLTATAVTFNSANVPFAQNENDELIISLPSTLAPGASGTVKVTYSGSPTDEQEAFVTDTHNGTPILWTLSEPYGAKDWWPCKQDLNDKVENIDVYITAPANYVAVANGLQLGQTTSGNNKITHFQHNYPIPAYLIAIAVTNYATFTQQAGTAPNNFPIVNYIYPENLSQAQQQLAVTLPIMDLFEDLFETYPFHEEKYGHAQCGFGGGMEHTTVSFMGSFGRELVAHELAHQWFGDKITCGTWNDIWLNEGFATYLSGLVVENLDGNDSFINWKANRIESITFFPGGSVYVPDELIDNVGRIFSNRLSYNKGAMVVHMLRFKMGDANFYQGVKNYLVDPDLAYGYAVTADLQQHLEAVSGMDLTEFFNDWVYQQGYPSYDIVTQPWSAGQVKITVNQTQSHPSVSYFEMPLPVRLYGAGGQVHNVVVENTINGQEFIVDVPFTVLGAEFDPENNIISANNSIALDKAGFSLSAANLYPNPASNQLTLNVPQGLTVEKAVFYNTLGQKVLETMNESSWNVSGLSSGMHFITLTTNRGTTQMKFIKE
ncbi:MAG: T9SS type A sorting domain-containing protein, partial [Flavobacterium sp.]